MARERRARRFLILSQGYPPDPMSVGQHLADVAGELTRRGHRVLVLTADRGYDDPSVAYPRRERREGVEVWRLPWSSFGKGSLRDRLLAAGVFLAQGAGLGLVLPRVDAVLVSTVPPLAGAAALPARWLRGVPLACWVMDLNPEQLVALGKVPPHGAVARALDAVNRLVLREARLVIALDRFMAERLAAKAELGERLVVIPPWPHEEHLGPVPHADNPFRREHGLEGKFVLMYSGNHTPSNPLGTFLEAAVRLRDHPDLVFLFVGGGQGKREVEALIERHRLPNLRSLPYQPLAALRYSLSAADVHLVAMGEPLAGIIHPCKVYGALAVERPVLYLGPHPSHITDLLEHHRCGWRVAHGDVAGTVATIERIRRLPAAEREAMGRRGRLGLAAEVSQRTLRARLCDHLEAIAQAPTR